jgi:hypothetical protein
MTTRGYRPSWARSRTAPCIESSSFRSLLVRHYRKDGWTNTLSCTIALRTRAAKKWPKKVFGRTPCEYLSSESHLRASQPETLDFLTHRDSPHNSFVFLGQEWSGMPVALHGSTLARTLTKMTAEGLPIRDENREVPAEGLLFVDAAGDRGP